ELSSWIRKCDLMIQPYPDGVSGRRGSAMAALSHGLPMVTTMGALTENVWGQSRAAVFVRPGDVTLFLRAANDLLDDAQERKEMGRRARGFYLDNFDIRHTIQSLRSAGELHLEL